MSAMPWWIVMAIALFFAVDLLVVALILLRIRRRNRYRGFDVVLKPHEHKGA